jgi:hypothetical protein
MSRRPDDPTALIAAAAVAGLLALIHALDTHAAAGLEAARRLVAAHPSVPAAALACAAAAFAARLVATRRLLAARARIALVPADSFDPQPDAVLRFAAQLASTRRTVRGWLDRPASAVRVALESRPGGQLGYVLEAPERAMPVLRAAARGYPQVELGDAPSPPPAAAAAVARAELVLARDPARPLAEVGLRPDPLTAVAAAVAALRDDLDDEAVIALDLLPLGPHASARTRRRLLRRARHRNDAAGQIPAALLPGNGPRRTSPAESVEHQVERQDLGARLAGDDPLFRIQLLLRARSRVPGRPQLLLRSLVSCFDQFAAGNRFRASGLQIPGVAFLGSDLPPRRRRFDRRLATGLFAPSRRGVATASELQGLLKPPTVYCEATNVVRSLGALAPPPAGLPAFDGQPELIPLGHISGEAGERLAGLPVAGTMFSYTAGRSRYGKTELALCQFLQLVRSGNGGLFLDPHEDALQRLKPYLAGERTRGRVVELNLAGRAAGQEQPGWNLFDVHGLSPREREDRVEAIVDAFASALHWDERNNRALTLTTQAAQALAALATQLPPGLQPTVFQIPTLLSDDDWRAACLPFLPQPTQDFFTHRFPRLTDEAITPVTNLIDRLRAATPVACLLGQSRSTYSVRQAMDQGLILLACPGAGGVRDRIVANLLVYDLLHAAKGRAALDPERRRPFYVFLDEVQTYDGAASGNLAALLEQTAKYGTRAFLLNQNPERLTQPTLNAVTTNRSHLLTTALNARGAALLAREWGGEPDPAAITQLERHSFLASVTVEGKVSRPFLVRTAPLEQLYGERPPSPEALPQAAPRQSATDVLAHLDTLDRRIREELRRSRRKPGAPANGGRGGGARAIELAPLPEART